MVVTKEAKCDTSTVIQVVTSTIAGAEMVSVVCRLLSIQGVPKWIVNLLSRYRDDKTSWIFQVIVRVQK